MLANDIQTISSILKTPENERKLGLKVRFESDDITQVIRNYCEGEDNLQYGKILNQLAKGEVQTDLLVKWMKQLRENISILGQQCEGFLDAILKINWVEQGDNALQEYETFLQHLVSAHTNNLKLVLKSLVGRLMPKPAYVATSGKGASIGNFSREETKQFEHVHRVLQAVFKIVPLSTVVLNGLLEEAFPYFERFAHQQACYVFNLLCVTKYLPSHRRAILEIIVDQMIKLDVHSPRQEIKDAEADTASEDIGEKDTVFEMDVDIESVVHEADMSSKVPDESQTKPQAMAHSLANLLDIMMNMLLTYVREICYCNEKLDWEATKKLYKDLLFVFDKLILPTHASSHIQFVMFYICSFRSALCDGYIDYLWKQVSNPNTPSILRQSAISYISSFLSRATYVSVNTVTACFDLMCGWLHRYIDSQDLGERSMSDVNYHGPFFSVCQAVFYVFAFRHKELLNMPKGKHQLLNMPKGFSYLQSLNFERIVTCCLNPLRFCLPAVVRNFASIARNYQLAYCYTIIEKNNRMRLQMVSRNPSQAIVSIKNALESFFPFDPYLLTRSFTHVVPIYRAYQGPQDDEPVEINESYDVILEDSFINPNTNPVTLSTSIGTVPELLLYGTSPGFAQITMVS